MSKTSRLNAPYGARCFLTAKKVAPVMVYLSGLNAPYGARCFLTDPQYKTVATRTTAVLCTLWRSVLSDAFTTMKGPNLSETS